MVILGGGFAGLQAAQLLQKNFGRRADLEIVLISRENYLLFTPMLHEVAAGDLQPTDIVEPLRRILRRVRIVQGDVGHIDVDQRVIHYTVGSLQRPHEISYDYLLLALGSETNSFGMAGVEAHATTMKSLADAALLRNRMVAMLEEAAQESNEERRRQVLTFVVAGGGFAGVETIGAMNDFLRDAIRYYPELDSSMLRLVLVHAGPVLLPELGERLGHYAQEKIHQRGVDVRLDTRVTACQECAVEIEPGGSIPTMSLVWTAGVQPAPVLSSLPFERVKGRIGVNEFLEVAGYEGSVWAVGDCAAVPDGKGGVQPPTAQHGIREAVVTAKNIEAAIQNLAPVPFRFTTMGQLASIGHRTGIAQVFGIRFSGFLAWCLWRAVYLMKRPGLAKKLRILAKWTFDLLFPREIEQLITLRDIERMEKLGSILRASRDADRPATAGLGAQPSPFREFATIRQK